MNIIVEIGTARGGTFYVWCKIADPDAVIVSIDLPGGPFGGGYSVKDIKKFRRYKRKNQRLYFLRKDSQNRATREELIKILKGRKIDFLFIDGDHRFSGIEKDWKLYAPLMKNNGLIVFHDILPHPKVPECKADKLWNNIKINFKHIEFIDRYEDRGWGQWGGIGVIYCVCP